MAKALDANIGPVHGPQAEPDGVSPMFRFPHELLTFRFVELLTRTPTPRPLRSSSWGYGFFADPSPGSSGDCTMPTTPGITNPRAANSHRVQALDRSSDCAMPTTPGVPNPLSSKLPWGRALADPASAPCPQPLASPSLGLLIPVGVQAQSRSSVCAMPRHHQSSSYHSRGARAIPVPATAPCPQPLAFPIPDSRRVRAPADPASAPLPSAPGSSRPRDAGPRRVPAASGPALCSTPIGC